MELEHLLTLLDYQDSVHYISTDRQSEPALAPLLRAARRAGVHGIYTFHVASDEGLQHSSDALLSQVSPVRPAVFVAKADSVEQARRIHQNVWNIGQAPFLIILLPGEIRIYTGFDYAHTSERGLLAEPLPMTLDDATIARLLHDFCADSINSGQIWQNRSHALHPERRVDYRLLANLKQLANILSGQKLNMSVANALIGKYVYIRYLRDRNILSDTWLAENDVIIEDVLGRKATVAGLRKLVDVLENRFNGNIFPLDFDRVDAPDDDEVALVASIFKGDWLVESGWDVQLLLNPDSDAEVVSPPAVRQLHLDFEAYEFQYIPVELLSSIYEQFMHDQGFGRDTGAIYTPEVLADYLLAEASAVRALRPTSKILDPACGSGVFLVLAYRRLIELELLRTGQDRLRPGELRAILQRSLFGVERVLDACYVTEFSLILTMLSYIEPPELHRNKQFQFPRLHNRQIFHCDFFDDASLFWQQKMRFDLVIGNPPWFELAKDPAEESYVATWIEQNQHERWVSDKRVSEAFSWRVVDVLKPNGIAALILPAKTLFNKKAERHRQQFFQQHTVHRITNFSNVRHALFGERAIAPAMTIVYAKSSSEEEKPLILHYGPFFINQVPTQAIPSKKELWTIVINASEIQTVDPAEAETGNGCTWKLAFWGNHRDRWALDQIRSLLPDTLGTFVINNKQNGWYIGEGPQLRVWEGAPENPPEELAFVPSLEGRACLNVEKMNASGLRLYVPDKADVFTRVEKQRCYKPKRGVGRIDTHPPHVAISAAWNYAAYSDTDFLIAPCQIELSAPAEWSDHLRAIAAYLNTTLVHYYLFFQTADWGIERDRVNLDNMKAIPLPHFTDEQIHHLATLHRELAALEASGENRTHLQERLDGRAAAILHIPEDLLVLARDFVNIRLTLNEGRTDSIAALPVDQEQLHIYARRMQRQLDAFMDGSGYRHVIDMVKSKTLVRCRIELARVNQVSSPHIAGAGEQSADILEDMRKSLTEQFSQWVYIQRSLRVFDGSRVSIYKSPRILDWTEAQACVDADDLIAYILHPSNMNW